MALPGQMPTGQAALQVPLYRFPDHSWLRLAFSLPRPRQFRRVVLLFWRPVARLQQPAIRGQIQDLVQQLHQALLPQVLQPPIQ